MSNRYEQNNHVQKHTRISTLQTFVCSFLSFFMTSPSSGFATLAFRKSFTSSDTFDIHFFMAFSRTLYDCSIWKQRQGIYLKCSTTSKQVHPYMQMHKAVCQQKEIMSLWKAILTSVSPMAYHTWSDSNGEIVLKLTSNKWLSCTVELSIAVNILISQSDNSLQRILYLQYTKKHTFTCKTRFKFWQPAHSLKPKEFGNSFENQYSTYLCNQTNEKINAMPVTVLVCQHVSTIKMQGIVHHHYQSDCMTFHTLLLKERNGQLKNEHVWKESKHLAACNFPNLFTGTIALFHCAIATERSQKT